MNHPRTITAALTTIFFSAFQQANALPDCEAWLENQVPVDPGRFLTPAPGRLVTADMNQVKAAGATIEPSRRIGDISDRIGGQEHHDCTELQRSTHTRAD